MKAEFWNEKAKEQTNPKIGRGVFSKPVKPDFVRMVGQKPRELRVGYGGF